MIEKLLKQELARVEAVIEKLRAGQKAIEISISSETALLDKVKEELKKLCTHGYVLWSSVYTEDGYESKTVRTLNCTSCGKALKVKEVIFYDY